MSRITIGIVFFLAFFLVFFLSSNLLAQDTKDSVETLGKDKHHLKIIALSPHIVELLYEIGAGQQIIATTTFADYPQDAKTIPVIGNYARLQIEKIVQLQPDVIIAWRSGSPVDDLERLSGLGLKVIYSNPKLLTDISGELRAYGKLTGREKYANERADQFDVKLRALKKEYAHKAIVNVFYEIWPQPLRTISGDAWPMQHLAICGAKNIVNRPGQDYPQISIEQVLQGAPDIIIQPISAQQPTTPVYNWSKWPFIPAVQNNFVLQPDADKLHRMSPRGVSEVKWLCESIDRTRKFLTR